MKENKVVFRDCIYPESAEDVFSWKFMLILILNCNDWNCRKSEMPYYVWEPAATQQPTLMGDFPYNGTCLTMPWQEPIEVRLLLLSGKCDWMRDTCVLKEKIYVCSSTLFYLTFSVFFYAISKIVNSCVYNKNCEFYQKSSFDLSFKSIIWSIWASLS